MIEHHNRDLHCSHEGVDEPHVAGVAPNIVGDVDEKGDNDVMREKEQCNAQQKNGESAVVTEKGRHGGSFIFGISDGDGHVGKRGTNDEKGCKLEGTHQQTGERDETQRNAFNQHAEERGEKNIGSRTDATGKAVVNGETVVNRVGIELEIERIHRQGKGNIKGIRHGGDDPLHGIEAENDEHDSLKCEDRRNKR